MTFAWISPISSNITYFGTTQESASEGRRDYYGNNLDSAFFKTMHAFHKLFFNCGYKLFE
jgi:hypothetical protein